MNDVLLSCLFGACIVVSSFFSGSETALTTLSEAAVYRLREKRHPQAARLERLRERLPQTISTLLIGNNLANIAAGSIGTVLAIDALGAAVRADPDLHDVRLSLARALARAGRLQAAREHVQVLLAHLRASDPRHADVQRLADTLR